MIVVKTKCFNDDIWKDKSMRVKLGKYTLTIRLDRNNIRYIELRNTQWRCGIDTFHVKRWRF